MATSAFGRRRASTARPSAAAELRLPGCRGLPERERRSTIAGAKDATFVPYVIGGVGVYNGTEGIGTKFGINGGGGVTFKLSGFDAFAEARFHNIFTDGFSSRIIPVSFGINFQP
ncbi:MAG: hypothetical protein U5K74_10735 [Gemmatimonadaceae bacterium]|nr:hypothetical protein [Gemmatimonadaceae bacterium]